VITLKNVFFFPPDFHTMPPQPPPPLLKNVASAAALKQNAGVAQFVCVEWGGGGAACDPHPALGSPRPTRPPSAGPVHNARANTGGGASA
jgi:hypothetical protein